MKICYFICISLTIFSCTTNIVNKNNLKDIGDIINNESDENKSGEHIIHYKGYEISNYKSKTISIENYKYNPNSDIILIEDTVFQRFANGELKLFSGKIRVIGKLTYTNKFLKEEVNENATLGLFHIKNGIFVGNQLFYSEGTRFSKIGGEYYLCQIKPFMDVVLGRDYIEVNSSEYYDFSIGSEFLGYKYYKILNPVNHRFEISRFWVSGKLFYNRMYIYKTINFIAASLNSFSYEKNFELNDTSTVKVYHYNGNLAFEGRVNSTNEPLQGIFYNFNKTETDLKHFKLQNSYETEIDFSNLHPIRDEDFKSYRYFFGIPDNLKTSQNSAIESNLTSKENSKYNLKMIINKSDYVCGSILLNDDFISDTVNHNNLVYGFCSEECKKEFKKSPDLFVKYKLGE